MSQYQNLTAQGLGSGILAGNISVAISAATGAASPVAYPAFGFTAPVSGTITSATLFFQPNSGVPDARVSLYADDGTGKPSTSGAIASSEGSGIAPAGNSFNTLSLGAGAVITMGTRYHAVIKNFAAGTSAVPQYAAGLPNLVGTQPGTFSQCASSTSADNWGAITNGRIACLFTTTTGDTFGCAVSQAPVSFNSNANRCFGSIFISPPMFPFVCDGITLAAYKGGTLSNTMTFRLYVNGALKSESVAIPNGLIIAGTGNTLYMPIPPTVIPPKASVRVVAYYNGGDGSNYARCVQLILPPGAKKPLGASFTLSTDGGTTWTDTTDRFVPFWLMGSYAMGGEFLPLPLNRRQFYNQR